MATFAHLAPGSTEVLDPRVSESVETYKESWGVVAETTWAEHTFKQVADGTVHGAKDNGDGTYTNPTVPEPTPTPKPLTKAQFEALLAANGGNVQLALSNWPNG